MVISLKFLGGAVLSSEADIYTVPVNKVCRLEHLIISNGSTSGTITIKLFDSSNTTSYELLNSVTIGANETIELSNLILESGDKIKASATTTTMAKITLFGIEGDA